MSPTLHSSEATALILLLLLHRLLCCLTFLESSLGLTVSRCQVPTLTLAHSTPPPHLPPCCCCPTSVQTPAEQENGCTCSLSDSPSPSGRPTIPRAPTGALALPTCPIS